MINFQTDIEEIIAFIQCGSTVKSKTANYEKCLRSFTKKTNESFLDERAVAIEEAILTSKELQSAFEMLASFCPGCCTDKCEEYCKD